MSDDKIPLDLMKLIVSDVSFWILSDHCVLAHNFKNNHCIYANTHIQVRIRNDIRHLPTQQKKYTEFGLWNYYCIALH